MNGDGAMSSSIQPRDKMAQYRDAALDFYNNGQTQPAPGDIPLAGVPGMDQDPRGTLGDMLAGVDLPPTPRGGPDNISRGEYEDLTKKLKTVARATQKQNRRPGKMAPLLLRPRGGIGLCTSTFVPRSTWSVTS